jgi:hypothetical protein
MKKNVCAKTCSKILVKLIPVSQFLRICFGIKYKLTDHETDNKKVSLIVFGLRKFFNGINFWLCRYVMVTSNCLTFLISVSHCDELRGPPRGSWGWRGRPPRSHDFRTKRLELVSRPSPWSFRAMRVNYRVDPRQLLQPWSDVVEQLGLALSWWRCLHLKKEQIIVMIKFKNQ